MTSTYGNWPRFLIAAITLGASVTVTTTVWAQGFGPDPFRPYNSQYDPYVYALGPASPAAGGPGGMSTIGNRNANQYQNFLSELQGPSISNSERYGIGQPYFRSVIAPSYMNRYRPPYQPRVKTERSFEETQRLISEKYLAYFEEKDPKKRAQILKDFHRARSLAARALSARREDPTRLLDAVNQLESESSSASTDRSSSAASTSRSGAPAAPRLRSGGSDSSRGSGSRTLPPPPALPFESSSRSGTGRTGTDVLNRARNRDKPADGLSKPATKGARDTRSNSRRLAPSLFPSDD
jgi:hypothetical protein